MPEVSFDNLLLVATIAILAPLIAGALPRLRIPAVVLEIVAGIVVGPTVLDWVQVDLPVQILALFGLAFLLFLAGLEIDLTTLRGRPLAIATGGYVVTLALGFAVGGVMHALDWVQQPLLIAVALSATSLGLVVPVLKDAGQVTSRVGQAAIAAATVADFAAIVVLSFFFSTSGGSAGAKLVLLAAFAVLVAATALVVSRAAVGAGVPAGRARATPAAASPRSGRVAGTRGSPGTESRHQLIPRPVRDRVQCRSAQHGLRRANLGEVLGTARTASDVLLEADPSGRVDAVLEIFGD
jgi:NhaP-type Na+/H+ or K+/H+ antiporter